MEIKLFHRSSYHFSKIPALILIVKNKLARQLILRKQGLVFIP